MRGFNFAHDQLRRLRRAMSFRRRTTVERFDTPMNAIGSEDHSDDEADEDEPTDFEENRRTFEDGSDYRHTFGDGSEYDHTFRDDTEYRHDVGDSSEYRHTFGDGSEYCHTFEYGFGELASDQVDVATKHGGTKDYKEAQSADYMKELFLEVFNTAEEQEIRRCRARMGRRVVGELDRAVTAGHLVG